MRIGTTATSVFALMALSYTTAAWGADYWVATTGSDSSAGSQSTPWSTIQHGVDTMQPGDTLTVADGSYAGFWMKNRQGSAQQRFVIRAAHPLAAKLTGPSATATDPNDTVQLVSVSFATIDGFDVTGAPRAGVSIRTLGDVTGADTTDDIVQNCRSHDNGAGVTAGRHDGIFTGFAQNVAIDNNEVDHNSEHGIYVSNSADNPIIRANRSHDNKANGLQINADLSSGGDGVISHWMMEDNVVYGNGGAAAINLDGATFGTLRNNLVYENAMGGVALFMGDAAEASHDNTIVDNTVYDPNGSRFAIQINDGANNNVVFNNVFWSASVGMETGVVTGVVHDYNVVCSYSGSTASAHESFPDVTRLFVDPTTSDYHPGVALIGQGTASFGGASAPGTDLGANARPQAGRYDIGCYQRMDSTASAVPDAAPGAFADAATDAPAPALPPAAVPDAGSGPGAPDGRGPVTAADAGVAPSQAEAGAGVVVAVGNASAAAGGSADGAVQSDLSPDAAGDSGDASGSAPSDWGANYRSPTAGCSEAAGPARAGNFFFVAFAVAFLAMRFAWPIARRRRALARLRSPRRR